MKRAFSQHRVLGSLWSAFVQEHPGAAPNTTTFAAVLVWSFTRSQLEHEAAALCKVHLFGREVERGEA